MLRNLTIYILRALLIMNLFVQHKSKTIIEIIKQDLKTSAVKLRFLILVFKIVFSEVKYGDIS